MRNAHSLPQSAASAAAAIEARVALPAADAAWKSLYNVGGTAALLTAALSVIGVISFVVWPPPPLEATVSDWFAVFQHNWLLGMMDLDLIMLLAYVANIPLLLALYVALRRANQSLMALAAALGLVAITTYFASSRVFEMLALSRQYAAVTTEAERAMLLASGQSMLSTYLGSCAPPLVLSGWSFQGSAFNISFVLWCVAGLLISVVMLRSRNFGKATGYLGIVGFVVTLGLFLPTIGVYLSLIGLVVQLLWYIMSGWGLLRLGRAA